MRMFSCSRCGSSFNETVVASIADCPRCKGRDGVTIALEPGPSSIRSVSSKPGEAAVPEEVPDRAA